MYPELELLLISIVCILLAFKYPKVFSKCWCACSSSKNSDFVILNHNFPFFFLNVHSTLNLSKKPGNRQKREQNEDKSDFIF